MKRLLYLFLLFMSVYCNSQNKQLLYNFAELPQSLLLNPAIETNYKFHVGIPLLSGFSTEFGTTGFVIRDLLAADNRPINDKVNEVLQKVDVRDYFKIHTQIELLSGGFRYNENTYFSFGFYEEIDGIVYYPEDMVTLLNEGNSSYLNRSFNISQLLYQFDFLGVLHAGLTKKMNNKLTLGGRFKIYSSALNMESKNNSGTFRTALGNNNRFIHYLDNVNVNLRTSGLVDSNDELIDNPSTYIKNTFFGSNLGIGFDFGMTYNISPQFEFTASILDVGFIHHKKNIKNSTANGSFTFEGIEFEYDPNNPRNYWQELDTAFKEQLPTGDNNESYVSWRPVKFNTSIKYSFGEKRSRYCYDNTYKDFYTDAFGAQLYSVFRPLSPQLALTGFYQKSFSNKIHAKVTYTIDNYSLYNIGVGVSTQIWKFNFYGLIDNLTQLGNISASNNISLQLGANLIFN